MTNGIFSPIMARSFGTIILFIVFLQADLAKAKDNGFQKLYNYYFPRHPEYGNTGYRYYFDTTLFGAAPPKSSPKRTRQLYSAFHGSEAAFREFLHNPDRDLNGAEGMEWSAGCLLLLLRLGDDGFSQLLSYENTTTKERVATAIEPPIALQPDLFPRTRARYTYRYVVPSDAQIAERARIKTVADQIKLTSGEFVRLNAALKREIRFSDVRIYRVKNGRGLSWVTAPKTLSKQDISNLQSLIRQIAPSQQQIRFQ